jgi:hypothetical protein
VREREKHSFIGRQNKRMTEYAHAGDILIDHRIGLVLGCNIILAADEGNLLLRRRMASCETGVTGGNMSDAKHCA